MILIQVPQWPWQVPIFSFPTFPHTTDTMSASTQPTDDAVDTPMPSADNSAAMVDENEAHVLNDLLPEAFNSLRISRSSAKEGNAKREDSVLGKSEHYERQEVGQN